MQIQTNLKMKLKKYFSIMGIIISVTAFSQVGIGTANPEENTVFHIDAMQDNDPSPNPEDEFLYEDDIVVDKDGDIGFGTIKPTKKLQINRPEIRTLEDIRIEDGSQALGKALISDANGKAYWGSAVMAEAIYGVFGSGYSGAITTSGTNRTNNIYTGAYIELPPGKWVVLISILANPDIERQAPASVNERVWVRTTFSTSSDNGTGNNNGDDLNGGLDVTHLASNIVYSSGQVNIDGAIYIDNNSDENKKYYYKIENAESIEGSNTIYVKNFASKEDIVNSIIAFRVGY